MALVAQQEREAISARAKKAALAAARARRVVLGGSRGHTLPSKAAAAASAKVRVAFADQRARDVLVSVEHAKSNGAVSLREIAAAPQCRGHCSASGGVWSAAQIKRVVERRTAC
jgi:hypothetical protein